MKLLVDLSTLTETGKAENESEDRGRKEQQIQRRNITSCLSEKVSRLACSCNKQLT
jgi:hypothetical protein